MNALRNVILTLAAVLSLAIVAPTASAEIFEGSFTEATGDGSSPDRDLTGTDVTYDNEAGTLTFTLNLAAADTGTPVQFATGVGTLNANGFCSFPLGVVGSLQPNGVVRWAREDDGTTPAEDSGDASIDIQGSKVVLTASDAGLRGLTPNCGEAVLSNPDDVNQIFDTTNAFAVKPRPKRPKLNLSITGPSQVKRGGKARVKVTVGNTGDGAATSVSVALSSKGGKVQPGVGKVKSIAPGGSSGFPFTVVAGKRAKGKIKIRAKVILKGAKALTGTKTIKIKKRGKKPKPPKSGGASLAGKIFWGFEEYQWDQSPDILGLYFSNSKFVHWGIPKGGLRNCSKVTAEVDEDGEMQPGCLRYSYNPKSGRITVGKAKGTYRKGDLKLKMDSEMWRIDGKTWYPGTFAKAGSRFKVTLINRGFYGLCGISAYCQTWAEYLTLEPSGKFGRTRSSLTTSGGGSLPFIAVGNYPPEDRGTYDVLGNGRIRFNYDNGETGVETLTIQTDKRGRPDAANEGVLLDDIWFYKEDEDE